MADRVAGASNSHKRKLEAMEDNEQLEEQEGGVELDIGEVATEEKLHFLDLNDECLIEILKLKEFFYLNETANTCDRLRYIARLAFVQVYNNDRLRYKKIKIMFRDNIMRNFGSLVEKMWLDATEKSLRIMVEGQYGDTLRRLIISNTHNVDFSRIKHIESIFKNLTELSFFKSDELKRLPLSHCNALTTLNYVGKFHHEGAQCAFPNLKYFRYENVAFPGYTSMEVETINEFFKRHTYLLEIIADSYCSAISEVSNLEKLVIRDFSREYYRSGGLKRLNNLKILDLCLSRDADEQLIGDLFTFLNYVPNPETLIELRLPRMRYNYPMVINLLRPVRQFTKLLSLKVDMYQMIDTDFISIYRLKKLQHLKLRSTRNITTDAVVKLIKHLKSLETMSLYNTNVTTLLLEENGQVDERIQNIYKARAKKLTIKYFKQPPNNMCVTEDYTEDTFELCTEKTPFYLYRSIVVN